MLFEEFERSALLPLPAERFPFFLARQSRPHLCGSQTCGHEAERSVHRDGHVEVAKAYYSVPPEYVGRRVWARCQVVRTLVRS